MSILNPSLLGLDRKLELSLEEVKAITAHLQANVPQVVKLVGNNTEAIASLVRKSSVVEVKRRYGQDNQQRSVESKLLSENLLYKRGKISNTCILILAGKVLVIAGKDGFQAEVGPWMTLGADALTTNEDEYVPDFSAYIDSPELRYLRILKPVSQSAKELVTNTSNYKDPSGTLFSQNKQSYTSNNYANTSSKIKVGDMYNTASIDNTYNSGYNAPPPKPPKIGLRSRPSIMQQASIIQKASNKPLNIHKNYKHILSEPIVYYETTKSPMISNVPLASASRIDQISTSPLSYNLGTKLQAVPETKESYLKNSYPPNSIDLLSVDNQSCQNRQEIVLSEILGEANGKNEVFNPSLEQPDLLSYDNQESVIPLQQQPEVMIMESVFAPTSSISTEVQYTSLEQKESEKEEIL